MVDIRKNVAAGARHLYPLYQAEINSRNQRAWFEAAGVQNAGTNAKHAKPQATNSSF
ncbi:MAG: hypothetical protein RL230_2638 [Pseudomonadota bacterium]|jgi:hypothetical protein